MRRSRRQKTTIEALRKDNGRLRRTMRKLETRKAALEVLPAKLRAIRKALESELAGLRASGRRCRSRCPLQTPISAGLCGGQLGRNRQAAALEIEQHFAPGLGALPVAVGDRQPLLAAQLVGTDDHAHALLVMVEPW